MTTQSNTQSSAQRGGAVRVVRRSVALAIGTLALVTPVATAMPADPPLPSQTPPARVVLDLRSPDARDAATHTLAAHGAGASVPEHATGAQPASDDAFDGGSVAIVVAIAGGLLVLLATGLAASRRVRLAR
jgi:hypothetical protein